LLDWLVKNQFKFDGVLSTILVAVCYMGGGGAQTTVASVFIDILTE
jgi:hypothetical protein